MMQYAIMYLIGAAMCNHWAKTSFIGKTIKEMLIDEMEIDDKDLDRSMLADIGIFLICLILWPILLMKMLSK